MAKYTASAGSKLEYATTEGGAKTQIAGLLTIPAIGDEPNKIDTTTLDNLKYETEINGLMPAPNLAYEFNMEDPSATANIKLVHDLATAGTVYYWTLTLSNGVVHTYTSDVKYAFKEMGVNEIAGFTMYHSPQTEIVSTIGTEVSA